MGQIALQIPQVGVSDSTEDPKIASDLTAIQTVINGNLDDTNLSSPNNAVRRLLLQASGTLSGGAAAGTRLFGVGADMWAGTPILVPLWAADSGLSGQPTDFQVAGKTAYGRVRAVICTNTASWGGVTLTLGLYLITGLVSQANGLGYTSSVVGGTTVAAAPGDNAQVALESGQFALPTSANRYALGVNSSSTVATNGFAAMTVQLYGYSA